MYIVLFGLVYEAIPLSKVAVLASALSFYFQHILLPIPTETRHVHRFAYDVVMIMEPATLLGTVYGVLASKIVPFWLITVNMAILLGYSAKKTFIKARNVRDREISVQEFEKQTLLNAVQNGSRRANYGSAPENEDYELVPPGSCSGLVIRSLVTVFVCFVVVIMNSMLHTKQGGGLLGYEIKCGSYAFYGSIVLVSLITWVITWMNLKYLIQYQVRFRNNSELLRNLTVTWDARGSRNLAALCFFAGFFSSFCGVGGSTIKNPILLHLNLNPTLAKSTSQFMLLSTVGASAIPVLVDRLDSKELCIGVLFAVFGLCCFWKDYS